MSQTSVAQIPMRIKARRCAAKIVVLVKFLGHETLPELKDFFSQTFEVHLGSSFFLPN